ncbi:MAG: LytTR family DNA-binding domain-containing protein [Coprobacillus sp.]
MKLVCSKDLKIQLQERLQKFEYLDIVLVERGMKFQGLAYVFDSNNIEELELYLESLERTSRVLLGKQGDRIYKVDISHIVYIEGFSKEAYVHTLNNQYEVKEKLYELEEILANYQFIRVSKSLIVNCRMIDSLEPLMNMKFRIYLKNGEFVELSRSYVHSFKNYLKMR